MALTLHQKRHPRDSQHTAASQQCISHSPKDAFLLSLIFSFTCLLCTRQILMRSVIKVLPFFLVLLHLFLVFPSIPPTFPRELLVFLVSLKTFCFFRCTPAFLEALLISMVFLMRAPVFLPAPPDKPKAFLVLIPCVRCLHSCSILPVI